MRANRCLSTPSLVVALGLAAAAPAEAAPTEPSFTVLWNFSAPLGGRPPTPALFATTRSGALYGTTLFGGLHQRGSVFALMPPAAPGGAWRKSVLWSFAGTEGAFPRPGLVDLAPDGMVRALYGTTEAGGGRPEDASARDAPIDRTPYAPTPAGGAKGAGTVFKLSPPTASDRHWSETILYSFAGKDGARPNDGLVRDAAGALYGTTAYGGAHGKGAVFKLSPPSASDPHWTQTVLHSFSGPDGAHPNGGLIADAAGALYGTTWDGGSGAGQQGAVFKLSPPSASNPRWTATVLHGFSDSDGAFPEGGLAFASSGALHGTTAYGGKYEDGGAVFKLSPPSAPAAAWTETVLHNFEPGTIGVHPTGRLIVGASGILYGTIFASNHQREVYELAPPTAANPNWALTMLHVFGYDDGQRPIAGLISDGAGTLYGTTTRGGEHEGGTVFRLTIGEAARR